MVAMWAEKEMRNLRRMRNAHLPCPIPVEVWAVDSGKVFCLLFYFLPLSNCWQQLQISVNGCKNVQFQKIDQNFWNIVTLDSVWNQH